nr:MAG TPA: hypothetical protein [Caudoviricetes sp.]
MSFCQRITRRTRRRKIRDIRAIRWQKNHRQQYIKSG